MSATRRRPMLLVFLIVLLDLIGWGIILPLIPYIARQFHASPVVLGFLMATFSMVQFLFSPIWGRWGDRWGRRPVLLLGLLGSTLAYLLFAVAPSLTALFIARALAGFFACNLSVAQAAIADMTPKNQRSAGMGLIGAAFGLGFILGPALAGLTGPLGQWLGDTPPFGLQFSALVAGGLNGINFIGAYFLLPETLPQNLKEKNSTPSTGRIQKLVLVFKNKNLQYLMSIFLLNSLAMALMEVMLFPFVQDRFLWNYQTASWGFAYVGLIMVFTQGYFIRQWMPRLGEKRVLFLGLLAMSVSFALIGLSFSVAVLALSVTVLGLGVGCMRPPVLGLASVVSNEREQGYVLGVMNSVSSVGRILGPVTGGWLYQGVSQSAPFFSASLLSLGALTLFCLIYRNLPETQNVKK